jgi:hypothetical protein
MTDQVTELQAEVARLRQQLSAMAALVNQSGRIQPAKPASPYDVGLPTTVTYTDRDVENWAVKWFGQILERRASNTRRWCRRWYDHPEVVARFHVLHAAYRQAETTGSALDMSSWFVDHLDKHLDVIFSADGPFAGCSPQRHSPVPGLEVGTTTAPHWPTDPGYVEARQRAASQADNRNQHQHQHQEVSG